MAGLDKPRAGTASVKQWRFTCAPSSVLALLMVPATKGLFLQIGLTACNRPLILRLRRGEHCGLITDNPKLSSWRRALPLRIVHFQEHERGKNLAGALRSDRVLPGLDWLQRHLGRCCVLPLRWAMLSTSSSSEVTNEDVHVVHLAVAGLQPSYMPPSSPAMGHL